MLEARTAVLRHAEKLVMAEELIVCSLLRIAGILRQLSQTLMDTVTLLTVSRKQCRGLLTFFGPHGNNLSALMNFNLECKVAFISEQGEAVERE